MTEIVDALIMKMLMRKTMAKKLTYQQISADLKNFSEVARMAYDGRHAYAAGYFEAMLANVIAELPAAKQEMYMQMVRRQSGAITPR